MMNRRNFLKKSGLVTMLSLTGCDKLPLNCCDHKESEIAQICLSNEEFTFIVAADPQPFWGAIENWQQTVDEINKISPDFVIVCGDLINATGDPAEIKAYKDIAAKLAPGIRLYELAGNHDIKNNPTRESIELYKKNFGELYYSFEHKGNLFIVLESTSMKAPSERTADWLSQQMDWFRQTLENAKSKNYTNKFVFLHHPVILDNENEEEEYFNLPVDIRNQLLELCTSNNVKTIFSGHWHRDKVITLDDIELVITGSCGKALAGSDLGFRMVKVSGSTIEHEFIKLPDQSLKCTFSSRPCQKRA